MKTKPKEMAIRAETDRYFLNARARLFKNDGIFFIEAVDKSTRRFSHVTNMNKFLSEIAGDELELDPDDPVFEDSSWLGPNNRVRKWFNNAKDLLKDKKYLQYIERALDDDRLAGEWENNRRPASH